MSGGKTPKEGGELRLRILEYIEGNQMPHFFQIAKDLRIHSDTLAEELKALLDQEYLIVYEGGYYSLTQEGLRELNQLRGADK